MAWSSLLDAQIAAERPDREACDVACREHVGTAAHPAQSIYNDAVCDRQTRLSGELHVWLDPDSGHDRIRLERPPISKRDSISLDPNH